MLNEKIKKLQEIIDNSNNIVFFGGAGVSTLSGLKDFRGKNGLYKETYNKPPEYYLSIDCLYNEPKEFYKFYRDKMNSLNAKPNVVHKYLVKLEEKDKLKAIITQNIDGLHQKAGSKNVLEIHGTIYKNFCTNCHKEYSAKYIFESNGIPICNCGGLIRPAVVLYGESLPPCFELAELYISQADTLIVAGTSLTVQPANLLVDLFKGKNLVIINDSYTPFDNKATLLINEDLEKVFSNLK